MMEHSITLSYICEVLSPRKLPDRMNPHSKPLELIAKSQRPHFKSNFGNSGSQTSTPILRPFHPLSNSVFFQPLAPACQELFRHILMFKKAFQTEKLWTKTCFFLLKLSTNCTKMVRFCHFPAYGTLFLGALWPV